MNISILTLGSRGDVQPYIPLSKGLMSAGYNVHLCTSHEFRDFVEKHNVPFRPIHAGYVSLASSEEGRAMMSGSITAVMKNMKSLIGPMIKQSLYDMAIVCEDADVIICHPKAFGGYDIAESKNIPVITAAPTPVVEKVGAFANPAFFKRDFGALLNKASYSLNALGTMSFMNIIREWRSDALGLPARRPFSTGVLLANKQIPVLYGISPAVLSNLIETSRFCLSGYWFMDEENFQPDKELAAFVANKKSICIGFGSMGVRNPDEFNRMILSAADKLGCNVIILSGWNGFNNASILPSNVLVRNSIPHDWLFLKVSAVVHHGGAGTTAACLRSGVPMVICPLNGDQPFWAKRCRQLGVLSESIPIDKLTGDKLFSMIQNALNNSDLKNNATRLSERIAEENGVLKAVNFLESCLGVY